VIAQRTYERIRRLELEAGIEPSHYEPGAVGAGTPHAERARAAQPDRSEVGV
jgi:hypothetical protein